MTPFVACAGFVLLPIERPEGATAMIVGPLVVSDEMAVESTTQNQLVRSIAKGAVVAVLSFAALGTAAALWDNPLFFRMMPAGSAEVPLLAALSLLLGLYVAIRRPFCSFKSAGAGGILGFIGVACPVCNKVLLLLFGGELLLTYFEPIRVYVAAAGVLILGIVIVREWRQRQRMAEALA